MIKNKDQEAFVKEKLADFDNRNIFENYTIDYNVIESILKNLGNGKSTGIAGAQAEMFKYGTTPVLENIIKLILEKIINLNIMPYFFNVGIIKPIVKDLTKSNNEVKNLRPITISDCIANIYEKVMIHEIGKTHIED